MYNCNWKHEVWPQNVYNQEKSQAKCSYAVMCMRRQHCPLIIISFKSAAEETLDLFLPGAFEKEQQSTLEEEFQACTCTFSVTAQTIIIYMYAKDLEVG